MPKAKSSISESQRDQAYKSLRRLLVLQQVQPGRRLREPEWAERLGVHRSALREAFARLEAEGLLVRGERTGYFAPTLTVSDLAEITQLRLALECLAIDGIEVGDGHSLITFTVACDDFERFLNGDYSLGVMEADRRFHEALIDAAEMPRLSSLYHRAPLPMIGGEIEDRAVWQKACVRTLAEHRSIIAALKAGNKEEAKSVLRTHLRHHPALPLCR